MAIADVTIIPIGTKTPSVSEYVADVQKILEGYKVSRQNQISAHTDEHFD